MIDRYLLRYFLAVIDQGNFSRGADACAVSQPTLSVGIAKLERELGQPLLRRDRPAGIPLFSEGYALAMAADHPLAHLSVIAPEQLADNVMIVRRHCELLSETSRYFTAHGVRPFFAARTTSEDRALALVRRGLGVTVMPDCFRHLGVVRPALADFAFTRTVGVAAAPHADPVEMERSDVVQALRAAMIPS